MVRFARHCERSQTTVLLEYKKQRLKTVLGIFYSTGVATRAHTEIILPQWKVYFESSGHKKVTLRSDPEG